jgi:hypothetical protein
MPALNLTGFLHADTVVFSFPDALHIDKVALVSFTTSSKPVPFTGAFRFVVYRGLQVLETANSDDKSYMTLVDILANAFGKRDLTIATRDDGLRNITYVHSDGLLANIGVDAELASAYGAAIDYDLGVYRLTCDNLLGPVHLRASPLVQPTAMVYLENTSSKGNIRPVLDSKTHLVQSKFMLGQFMVNVDSEVRFSTDRPQFYSLGERKTELHIRVLWQNDAPFLTESSEFSMQLFYE